MKTKNGESDPINPDGIEMGEPQISSHTNHTTQAAALLRADQRQREYDPFNGRLPAANAKRCGVIQPSAELARAYLDADAVLLARKCATSKGGPSQNTYLPDVLSATLWAKLLATLLLVAGFVWLVAKVVAAMPTFQ